MPAGTTSCQQLARADRAVRTTAVSELDDDVRTVSVCTLEDAADKERLESREPR
jgi:hypothetical protein